MRPHRRGRAALQAPAPPTVPDLVAAPELAAIFLLELALEVAKDALLAEHPTLVDDFHRPRDQAPVLDLANTICLGTYLLRDTLRRYRCAARDVLVEATDDDPDSDVPF